MSTSIDQYDIEKLSVIKDWLLPTHAGSGIITDASETLLYDWARERMCVQKIIGVCFVENEGSQKVLQKLGFTRRGSVTYDLVVKGVHRTSSILFDWPPIT